MPIKGPGRGLPLGTALARVVMWCCERKWLDTCPNTLKYFNYQRYAGDSFSLPTLCGWQLFTTNVMWVTPFNYQRYVGDTFSLFSRKSYVNLFLWYLNSQHRNTWCATECEEGGNMSFPDCSAYRRDNKFGTLFFS